VVVVVANRDPDDLDWRFGVDDGEWDRVGRFAGGRVEVGSEHCEVVGHAACRRVPVQIELLGQRLVGVDGLLVGLGRCRLLRSETSSYDQDVRLRGRDDRAKETQQSNYHL
jgi:hypothetical protein